MVAFATCSRTAHSFLFAFLVNNYRAGGASFHGDGNMLARWEGARLRRTDANRIVRSVIHRGK